MGMSGRRHITYSQARAVQERLDEVYDKQAGHYKPGWTDQRVSDALRSAGINVNTNQVYGVRAKEYGRARSLRPKYQPRQQQELPLRDDELLVRLANLEGIVSHLQQREKLHEQQWAAFNRAANEQLGKAAQRIATLEATVRTHSSSLKNLIERMHDIDAPGDKNLRALVHQIEDDVTQLERHVSNVREKQVPHLNRRIEELEAAVTQPGEAA